MAFGMILEWDRDFSLERYDEASRRLGTHDRLADGCLSHAVGLLEDGAARLVEVWESPEHAEKFTAAGADVLADLGFPPPARVTTFDAWRFATA